MHSFAAGNCQDNKHMYARRSIITQRQAALRRHFLPLNTTWMCYECLYQIDRAWQA